MCAQESPWWNWPAVKPPDQGRSSQELRPRVETFLSSLWPRNQMPEVNLTYCPYNIHTSETFTHFTLGTCEPNTAWRRNSEVGTPLATRWGCCSVRVECRQAALYKRSPGCRSWARACLGQGGASQMFHCTCAWRCWDVFTDVFGPCSFFLLLSLTLLRSSLFSLLTKAKYFLLFLYYIKDIFALCVYECCFACSHTC